ncbi:DUF438 domain-containing protein [Sporosarcina sp. Marseille-Q4063]|uniref:PAS domain-containing protein n=1 Tax=Sporosarcina sp. Marseille-Q4063 TaxID=2810514 RepID=UPI001BAFC3F6|nr:PAS domain-containing protein [Sporosarcina sp. Marseille-Q4063]QUW23113.1 DUF438 domain-containing protein [Sporosarcina sp. Marseille-Q4063]
MLNMQFDIKRINLLKEILLHLRHEGSLESIKSDVNQLKSISVVNLLLMQLELINGDHGITIEDVKRFSSIESDLSGNSTIYHPSHPVQIFKEENAAFQVVMNQINQIMESLEEDQNQTHQNDKLKQFIFQLEEFHNHYNRKEKIFFPIMERYGHYAPTRTVWRADIRIRARYQALKRQIDPRYDSDITRIRKRYDTFENEFKEMIYQEEAIILPILQSIFSEDDWLAIANESEAFGYAIIEAPGEPWLPKRKNVDENKEIADSPTTQNIVLGGGGYLTTEEAELILNNLPLEITFVDKNDMFKYFNEITEASEMMLVRTPISIGRNVANCHPPKSLMKVMTLMRDLKTGKRTSESMWFKRKNQYIHLTYKAIFNDKGEFLGVLEYVQDIQPFFELPSEVKMGLT